MFMIQSSMISVLKHGLVMADWMGDSNAWSSLCRINLDHYRNHPPHNDFRFRPAQESLSARGRRVAPAQGVDEVEANDPCP